MKTQFNQIAMFLFAGFLFSSCQNDLNVKPETPTTYEVEEEYEQYNLELNMVTTVNVESHESVENVRRIDLDGSVPNTMKTYYMFGNSIGESGTFGQVSGNTELIIHDETGTVDGTILLNIRNTEKNLLIKLDGAKVDPHTYPNTTYCFETKTAAAFGDFEFEGQVCIDDFQSIKINSFDEMTYKVTGMLSK